MASPKRPKSLLALLLFFCWVDARSLGGLIFPKTSGSYHFYESLGRPWIHFALQILMVALAATATGYLWRPKRGWLEASLLALGTFAVSAVAGTWYSIQHLDVVRSSYAAGRTARGLPAPTERLDQMFRPEVLWMGTVGMVAFLAILAGLAWRRREYVAPEQAVAV